VLKVESNMYKSLSLWHCSFLFTGFRHSPQHFAFTPPSIYALSRKKKWPNLTPINVVVSPIPVSRFVNSARGDDYLWPEWQQSIAGNKTALKWIMNLLVSLPGTVPTVNKPFWEANLMIKLTTLSDKHVLKDTLSSFFLPRFIKSIRLSTPQLVFASKCGY
jgi:hypothetical protein